jgi:hypothetical protein
MNIVLCMKYNFGLKYSTFNIKSHFHEEVRKMPQHYKILSLWTSMRKNFKLYEKCNRLKV